jgi:glycosyltransferase involved in cell wall biosynthesis
MRTLMFTTDYLPNVGGVAAHVYELAKAMCEAGHEATVVTNLQQGAGADPQEGPPRVLRVSERLRWLPMRRGRRAQFAMNMLRPMLGELRGYDLVHFHTVDPLARALSVVWGSRPQIATNHTSMFVADAGDPRRAAPWRRFFRRMDGVIAPSAELASLTAAVTQKPEQIRYIPNGVDASRFHPEASGSAFRDRYGIGSGQSLVLCPRRLVKKNGCIFLARAAPAIVKADAEVRLVFAGDGPERGNIEAELHAGGCLDRAIFSGNIPNVEMPAAYAAADVTVVPSLIEATSISVLEAMASGRPVVASRTGGLPSLIEHGRTGYLVEPGDAAGLAAAVCDLLADGSGRARMGELARDRVLREFTWDRIAGLTVDACRAFLGCGREQAA